MVDALRRLLRLFLRIFFRRVETSGMHRVPDAGPLVLVLNHPNGLIDPLFVLAYAPRPVAFLAKSPLFRMPLIGTLIAGSPATAETMCRAIGLTAGPQ